jgi:hypothetical protein
VHRHAGHSCSSRTAPTRPPNATEPAFVGAAAEASTGRSLVTTPPESSQFARPSRFRGSARGCG